MHPGRIVGTLTLVLLTAITVSLGVYFAVASSASQHIIIQRQDSTQVPTPTPTQQATVPTPTPNQPVVVPATKTVIGSCDPATEVNHGWVNDSVTVASGSYVVADVGRGSLEVTIFAQSGAWTPVDGGVRVGATWVYSHCDPAIVQKQAEQHCKDMGNVPCAIDPTTLFSRS